MNPRHQFTATPDGEYLCDHCDMARTCEVDWCPSCEAMTSGYRMPEPDAWERDIVPASVCARYLAVGANERIDRLASRRRPDMSNPAVRSEAIITSVLGGGK